MSKSQPERFALLASSASFFAATHSQIESVGFMRGRTWTADETSTRPVRVRKRSAVAQWSILWTTVKLSDYWDGWMDGERALPSTNGQRCGRPRLSRLGQLRSAFRLHPSSTPSDHRRRPSTHSLSSVTHAHASPHSLYQSHARLSEFAPNCELTSPRWPDRLEPFPKAEGSREEQHRTNWAVVT